MNHSKLKDARLKNRRVFLRADLNVPLENGEVADDTRIRGVLPTLNYLLDNGASVIMASHLGRPGGKPDPKLTLEPVARRLQELLGRKVTFAPDCVGARVNTLKSSLKPGDVLLLENLRFHPEEKAGDGEFARQLALGADIYVNDAFGTSHRSHASMTGVPREMGGGFAGLLVQRELEVFEGLLENPERPFTLVLGGAKVSDKLPVIENLLESIDHLLIGGGMAFTFMKARGLSVGRSLLEIDRLGEAQYILQKASDMGIDVHLPQDVVVSESVERPGQAQTVDAGSMEDSVAGLDIGPRCVEEFTEIILDSRTVVWNGPMGVFEVPPFDGGTRAVADAMARAADAGATTVVGGGDSARAVAEAGLQDRITFVSTGGGASLKLLQGLELPALAVLKGEDG